MLAQNLTCGFQAVKHGHADVKNCNVGFRLAGFLHSLTSVVSFRTDLPIRMRLDERDQPAAYDFVIVSNQNAKAIHN